MFNIKFKLSRLIGLAMNTIVFYLIIDFYKETKVEENKLKVIVIAKDLALAFITAISVKGFKDVIKIKWSKKNDK